MRERERERQRQRETETDRQRQRQTESEREREREREVYGYKVFCSVISFSQFTLNDNVDNGDNDYCVFEWR